MCLSTWLDAYVDMVPVIVIIMTVAKPGAVIAAPVPVVSSTTIFNVCDSECVSSYSPVAGEPNGGISKGSM